MNVLFCGISLFIIAFFVHVLAWRIHLPKNHTKVLLLFFFGALVCGIFILLRLQKSNTLLQLFIFKTGYEYLRLSLLFISLTLAYVATYSAIEVDSPSLVIAMMINRAGSGGLNKENLNKTMTDDVLIKPRVGDLVEAKLVHLNGDIYTLTPQGILLACIFKFYRKLLNAQKGG